MGLDKRQRAAIGLGVTALGALLADRVIFLPGPSTASAAALEGEDMPRIVSGSELVTLAAKLRAVCEGGSAAEAPTSLNAPDPFLSPWRVIEASFGSENADDLVSEPATAGRVLPVLTGIVSAGGRGYAVLNGKPLAVGVTRDGYTLVDLTDQTASIAIDGAVFTLRVHPGKISP